MTLVFLLLWVLPAHSQECALDLLRFHVVRPRAVATTEWDRANNRRGTQAFHFVVPYPFEMLATQVTMLQWAYVMGQDAPPRPMQAAHRLSCGLIAEFFERLNGLSRDGDPRLGEFFEGHRPGDHYRLPTEREWTLVATHALNETMLRRGKLELDDHAWHAGNSRRVVHDVAQKEPLWLGGLPFYDLFGNLEELTSDHFTDWMSEAKPTTSPARVARGGSTKTRGFLQDFCTRRARVYWREDYGIQDRYLGFRIVRDYPAGHPDHVPFIRR